MEATLSGSYDLFCLRQSRVTRAGGGWPSIPYSPAFASQVLRSQVCHHMRLSFGFFVAKAHFDLTKQLRVAFHPDPRPPHVGITGM